MTPPSYNPQDYLMAAYVIGLGMIFMLGLATWLRYRYWRIKTHHDKKKS